MWIVNNTRIEIVQGDITKEHVDAIVNAANSRLAGGGGVDGAIHRAGGPAIMAECRMLGGCETGDAKITTGGNLPAKHAIHAVGPIYHGGAKGEAEFLASCYRRSLEIAVQNKLKSVAFAAISCGIYGYPIPEAACIALSTVKTFVESHPQIELVRFVLFSDDVLQTFRHTAEEVF